ncbi:hypothetical protein QBC34DRAFT_385335 [Podospora aff. communis PSN243]|uniref:LrgB-like protein n=1 Tax=Podospora aff. communis PSN243 TaxID=3040156 RepID=A0AAV9G8J7_9PEZI|nr:hypothetical protein QBC34DRAFT_385335 [Podospora aff. communis PSN243]
MPPTSAVEMWSKVRDGFVAVVIGLVVQLLIAGIQSLLEDSNVDFPPSVVAMAGVFAVLLMCGCFVPGVDGFYRRHLQGPANLLNRHMSIGFTIPFVMICRSSLANPGTIGLIIVCFLLTGIFNTILSYAFALPLQSLMSRWTYRSEETDMADEHHAKGESEEKKQPSPKNLEEGRANLTVPTSHLSTSTMVFPLASRSSTPAEKMLDDHTPAEETLPISLRTATYHFLLRNPMLILSWLLLLVIGLPLRYATQHDTFLATSLLFAVWFTTLAIQCGVKTTSSLSPTICTLLSGLFNPVLWTSLAMIAYIFVDCAISHRSLAAMLDTLQTHNTLSELILRKATGRPLPTSSSDAMAAGDIALSILNAGLVSWGLKLYEYRRQLLSRAGLTVFSVSSLLALGNVALGPLFAHALGLGPASRDLAFAARSVTLALGSPVMSTLGGDAGLNATMVVVSGIIFQMGLGFGAGAWLEGKVNAVVGRWRGAKGEDAEAQPQQQQPEASCCTTTPNTDDPTTVAAGVTIGINAAAMGTAYLYEVNSDAAPYSALSMMALGIMTVVFSSIPPLAVWVVGQVSSAV